MRVRHWMVVIRKGDDGAPGSAQMAFSPGDFDAGSM